MTDLHAADRVPGPTGWVAGPEASAPSLLFSLDTATGKPDVLPEGTSSSVASLAWSTDGKTLAACVVRDRQRVDVSPLASCVKSCW
jgi:hypothetical protein